MSPSRSGDVWFRRALLAVGVIVAAVALAFQLPRLVDRGVLPIDDFAEYWAAGRLNLQAGNPYDVNQLDVLQRGAGLPEDEPAIIMWNPPWTLTFVMPFGLPPYPLARLVWLLFHMGLVVLCADLLWHDFGGTNNRRWIAWFVALTFCPTLITLKSGQISPFILAGLTGFLVCQRGRHDFWAGAVMVFASIKPHLVYLIWVAVVLWALDQRRWRVLLGIAAGFVGALGVPIVFNHDLIHQYLEAIKQPPVDWMATTFGTLLRMWFGSEHKALVFLPSLLGFLWLVPYWLTHRRDWRWEEQLPLLLLVSNSTAAYGWLGDQVILLAALAPMAAWLEHSRRQTIVMAVAVYANLNLLDLCINIFFNQPEHQIWHLWTAPALLAGFLIVRAITHKQAAIPQQESERAYG